MGKLDGRVAVITGGGRGIGAAVAECFAAEGASVLVNDLGAPMEGGGSDAGPAQEVVERINAAGGKALADGTDVTNFEAVEAMIQRATGEFGRLDILVNVAGIIRDGMIFKMDETQWDSVIDVHLKGTFNTIRHASAWWRANRGGQYRIINFVSGSGLYGSPTQPNYAAAKMGIVGLTFSCANSLGGYGVTANCIAPIAFTRMTASLEGKSTVMDYSPDNPRISAENVVPPVLYLAMEQSDWLNGRVIEAGNGKIGLFSNPVMTRQIMTDGLWDNDVAINEMETAFREAIYQPNPFSRSST
ncbi:MAG: SDR family NAD(P)-dependent oxidoreductase [Deltaproteobacteria bacterium]|nr:SDR family NAD(P)-dependent oxidoreductase [Deltaproteobacteria bacterium]